MISVMTYLRHKHFYRISSPKRFLGSGFYRQGVLCLSAMMDSCAVSENLWQNIHSTKSYYNKKYNLHIFERRKYLDVQKEQYPSKYSSCSRTPQNARCTCAFFARSVNAFFTNVTYITRVKTLGA